ncbi:MAG: DUF1461 domain-containing protein [Chloroflexi bacterium]|nr:DUF1461 domain-containing protein [Chloroflexota bacterium]
MKTGPARWEIALAAVAFAVFGLVALSLAHSGSWAYLWIAPRGDATFYVPADSPAAAATRVDSAALLRWHAGWSSYVTGLTEGPPLDAGPATFTVDEYRHMADVRYVFRGAEVAAVVALVTLAALALRARSRGVLPLLARSSALASAALVTLVAAFAAFAFEPLFLAFHEVLFPQGNFLFGPRSNLIALYPDEYWYGVTLRVALTFIAVALAVALAAHLRVKRLGMLAT